MKSMELRQMIEGCFERQNKLIARLEMELEALSNFNGKQMLDSRDMRLQLKVCDRTLIRWRMSGKLPSFKISGKVYFWAFDVYKFLREEYGTAVLPEALEEQEPITINNKNEWKIKVSTSHLKNKVLSFPAKSTILDRIFRFKIS